ncbi:MAG: HK97 family phage prohead protease [Clostridiales bacterium]|nr:HK97 family phage prohead protease [Clostridiales bacterium]
MKIEIRTIDGADTVHVDGYVNAVGRDSRPLPSPRGRFVEQVAPGTFKRACDTHTPAVMHNHQRLLKAEATFREDNIGLHISADIHDADIAAIARRGELRGWSFGFCVNPGGEVWDDSAQPYARRTLNDISLSEVSLIDSSMTPCYVGTSVEVRGETEAIIETRSVEDNVELTDTAANIKNMLEIERMKLEILKEKILL